MAEFQKVFSPQIKALYLRLSTVQKIAMVSVMVALVLLFFIVISLVNGPKMGILFTNLSPRDASEITEKLRENNIQYQLEDTGLTILAPQSKIYALRLSLVVDGMPQSSIVGYELFDPASLDVSNSREELNDRRVLEGELARTIAQFNEVDGVRVNIVIPDKQHSKEDQKEVTASVLLKLKENIVPKRDVIRGIEHLIASSVEGLETANVKVLDSRGVRLSDNHTSESLFRLKSSQYELQANVESYLAQKATTLLEGVVGCGNAIVQVSVELNFRRVGRTLLNYYPDKTVIGSEESAQERSSVGRSRPRSKHANTITNHEVSKTGAYVTEGVRTIQRLSVAVVINGMPKETEEGSEPTLGSIPRSQQEMDQLTEVVKKAVGFNTKRGDEISVVTMPIWKEINGDWFGHGQSSFADYNDVPKTILLVAAMIAGTFLLKSLLDTLFQNVVPATFTEGLGMAKTISGAKPGNQSLPTSDELSSEELSQDVLVQAETNERIKTYFKEKPGESALLLKAWLSNEE